VRLIRRVPQSVAAIRLIVRIVTLEPGYLGVALEGQDIIWLPRSSVGAGLDAPASPSLAAGAAKVAFPRWSVGMSKKRSSTKALPKLSIIVQR